MSEDANLPAYFERIGFAGSIAPNLQTLQALHELHPAAIPFENLAPLMGDPVLLDKVSLEGKLLRDRRGGYCFEHNMLFWRVLRELEYTVRAHFARVLWGHPEGAQRPRDHMILTLEINGVPYLADVGFGGLTLTAPLRLRSGLEQETPHEKFRITGDEPNFVLEAQIGQDWRPLYAFDLTSMIEADFEAANFFASTHPEARFRNHLVAARTEKGKRFNLLDNRLTIHSTGQDREQRLIEGLEELRTVLAETFGLALPPAEQLDPALERILARAADQAA